MHWDKDSKGGVTIVSKIKKTAFTKGVEVKLSTLKKKGIYIDLNICEKWQKRALWVVIRPRRHPGYAHDSKNI